MPRTLPRSFYSRSPDAVARDLLGKVLVSRLRGQCLAGRIVEVEAYFGKNDPAAHSAAGKTARNAVLFGPPGHAYVYFIYGMHSCVNVSCEPEGQAGCVLIRALEPLYGLDTMARLRGLSAPAKPKMLASGPGRLCQALGITRATHNELDFTNPVSELQIQDDGFRPEKITATPRIGIHKAVEKPHRFLIDGNAFVSKVPQFMETAHSRRSDAILRGDALH